jgi:DNA replication and repair protein RecF
LLEAGVVLVVGPNGSGKTNLLEAVHVAGQGFSPRTRSDAELVRFGETWSRTALAGEQGAARVACEVTLRIGDAKRARLNGAPLRAAEQLRSRIAMLVFTPDRLAVVKGGPAVRRAYFDRALARVAPARANLPPDYAAALAQRNAALRRAAAGIGSLDAIAPWTERVALLGAELVEARLAVLGRLAPRFAERAGELGLAGATVTYAGEPPSREVLEARLERDVERGSTGAGPHLDDVVIASDGRDLRSFGSQGEQRLSVLALLLAEAEVIAERRDSPALLLLDDVLSELDGERRRALLARVSLSGQALVTTAGAGQVPVEPAQVVNVVPGAAG